MIRGQRLLVTLFASALLTLSLVGGAAAQPPINIGGPGLVNVQIGTIEVNVPVAVAANLCDINVALLVGDFRDDGDATCTATAESIATPGPGAGTGPINIGGPGLVNVQIGGLFVDLPIGIAANICDVNAAVLVGMFEDDGDATCTATATSIVSPGPGGGGNN